jgi:hypothetical protein
MASAHTKQSESKYVSCFADSRPDVDITFRDVLLQRPTDHYIVGVDNFSMTNTSLSMLEPAVGHYEAVIRIVRNPANLLSTLLATIPASADLLNAAFGGATGLKAVTHVTGGTPAFNLSISSNSTPILSMQQLMHKLELLAGDVNLYMNTALCTTGQFEYGFVPKAGSTTEHLKFMIGTDGKLTIQGTKAFWANFSIEIPTVRNQFGFLGSFNKEFDNEVLSYTKLRRFLSVNPESGDVLYNKILVNRFPKTVPTTRAYGQSEAEFELAKTAITAFNKHCIGGTEPQVRVVKTDLTDDVEIPKTFANETNAEYDGGVHTIFLRGACFSSLERRIALEVGCSLPTKNSPMVDHQKEAPDFVIGRWIWRTDPRIESSDKGGDRKYHSNLPACTEYQGARDRITYHELQAQAKIQTLRIKLFARIRTFDEILETYGMRVIVLPTSDTDWWHTRLHFISKD